jgi:hypothetical protein
VPRTKEVRARTDLELYMLDRDDLVNVVHGYGPSAAAADAVIAKMLGVLRTEAANA